MKKLFYELLKIESKWVGFKRALTRPELARLIFDPNRPGPAHCTPLIMAKDGHVLNLGRVRFILCELARLGCKNGS